MGPDREPEGIVMNRVLVASCSVVVAVAAFVAAAGSHADDGQQPAAPAAPAAPADAALAAKEEKVRKLLRLTGSGAAAQQVLDKMLEQFRKMPQLPAGFVDKFKAKADVKALTDLAVPSYVKHLDDATLDAAIAFYETPAGQQWVAAQPAMMSEAMVAGQMWGTRTASEVMKELKEAKEPKEGKGEKGEDGK
jgi:hypothetical protein